MKIELRERTAETAEIFFQKADHPLIRKYLPQKAKSLKEALKDFEKTKLPVTTCFGKTF